VEPFLIPDDLYGFVDSDSDPAVLQQMINDATALAVVVAPCLADEEFLYRDAVKAILRGILSRWATGAGPSTAISSTSAGPFITNFDNKSERRGALWPSEIQQLQSLCRAFGMSVGTTDMVPLEDELRQGFWNAPDHWQPIGRKERA
jgi:hypothetical protein